MRIILDGKIGDSNQLTEHCRFIDGAWYSSAQHLPESLKKHEKYWRGISPGELGIKPLPPPVIKIPAKPKTPKEKAAATIATLQSDSPCINC